MVSIQDLYAASNAGLDIILLCVTDPSKVRDAIQAGKKFALRDERTPSSSARQYNGVWKVTDFGDTGHAESPIDLYMRINGIQSFPEAVARLAQIYNLTDELRAEVNKPHVEKKPANIDQEEGKKYFEFNEAFSDEELKILGPNVRQETCDALHWHSVKWVCDIKNRDATYKYSNDKYPIFMRECLVSKESDGKPERKFYKIYEPLNTQKQWRFQYTPKGEKPRSYINGLAELTEEYERYNSEEEALFFQDPRNEGKPYKQKKLECAVICSGERDALCIRALGYFPLWFNSETYRVSDDEMWEIRRRVETIYNIPDIDSTGVLKGTEMAIEHINIHTIWLPEWLKSYRDRRGKPKKDFRDWSELRPRKADFKNLLQLAKPAKFWVEYYNEKKGNYQYEIDSDCMRYFLTLHGFYALHDDNITEPHFIRVQNNIVRNVTKKDIYNYVIKWAEEQFLPRDVRNLILNSPRISNGVIANLREITLDFDKADQHSQFFFFKNITCRVTADGIEAFQGRTASIDKYVWEENVIPHHIRIMENAFEITSSEHDGKWDFDIQVKSCRSNFFRYLINSSRMYWRKELEELTETMPTQEAEKYKRDHHFSIDGPLLSPEEIEEQKRNLINKIFAVGYYLHNYKSMSKAWALFSMDNKVAEDGECNGRTGKSFLFKVLSYFGKTVKLSGRNPKLMDNPHVFDQVTEHTDYLLIDDCDKYLHTGVFYDIITSDMTVNPKNNQSYTIPFEKSPKIAFTTNYVPANFDPSTEARLLYLAYSDYYHQKTEDNEYLETRSIRDDFGKELFAKDYSEEEWSDDCNFIMQCCRFYLSVANKNIKIQPPMKNIVKRKLISDMVVGFEEWATAYFSHDNLNRFIEKDEAMKDFMAGYNLKSLTSQRFTKALRAYALLNESRLQLNPPELCNAGDRIIRKNADNQAKIMIYMRDLKNYKPEADFVPDEQPF